MTDKVTIPQDVINKVLWALEYEMYGELYSQETKEAYDALLEALRAEQPMVAQPAGPEDMQVYSAIADNYNAAQPAPATVPLAQNITDAMMDCVDRLGSEAMDVDPRVWDHLLVYAPAAQQPTAALVPLTEDQVLQAIHSLGVEGHGRVALTYETGPYDIDKPTLVAMRLARVIEHAHGITAAGDKP